MLDTKQIMAIIPHRAPILMVERILEMEPGKRAVGIKNVSINEPFFQGHYPGMPIFPGVLILEAMAQTGGVAIMSLPEYANKMPIFAGLDEVKFKRPVYPGDQLRLEVEIVTMKRGLGIGSGKAYVGDELKAEATLKFAMVDASQMK
ncbi:MAG TPA: 3-hydroxyacyl-ACP dehydratase FabZ [Symbiobacteriaceae bacterium]|jgi:3-hydroxyacyl-[acyl-carrier-protein] dehydratase|nr:3-hydroxyacyl-ACP dehydratase FabZ [Symbiobacteriaceae bacterium]